MSALDIVATSVRSALGQSALQTAMGIRAGLFEPHACAFMDKRGRAIGVCRVGGLSAELHGYPRLLAIAAGALREACAALTAKTAPPLAVVLPAAGREDDDPRFSSAFIGELAQAAGVAIDGERSRLIRRGHAGFGWALQWAREELAAGATQVLVGGVDSYYHPEVLAALDQGFRLHAIGAEEGIVPAEAAGFVVLRATGRDRAGSPAAEARVVQACTAQEPSVDDSGQPNLGRAITDVVRDAGAFGAPWVINDVNAERYRLREYRMVSLRQQLAAAVEHRLPAELGDIGAASGPVALSLAAQLWSTRCAPAERALVLLSSDGPERAAITLEGLT